MLEKSPWEIMERLLRLDPQTYLHERGASPDLNRWSVVMKRVVFSIEEGGACSCQGYGLTPSEAIRAAWKFILKVSEPPFFLIRHNCIDGVCLHDEYPQAWVRWNDRIDNWEDVYPTEAMLAAREFPRDLIRSIGEQRSFDRRRIM